MTKEDIKALIEEIDFVAKASNVYRTKNYIVRQELSVELINGKTFVLSKDTFFARTKLRDAQFEFVQAIKKASGDGRRVPATMTTRTYED